MNPNPHETIYQRLLRAFTFSEPEPLEHEVSLGKVAVEDINDVKDGYQKHDTKECYASKK